MIAAVLTGWNPTRDPLSNGFRNRRLLTTDAKTLAMLTHCNGGMLNASQLAASLGVSYNTVSRYVDILEQTFLIRKRPRSDPQRCRNSPTTYARFASLSRLSCPLGCQHYSHGDQIMVLSADLILSRPDLSGASDNEIIRWNKYENRRPRPKCFGTGKDSPRNVR
jgi:hypothetical protein